MRVLVLVKATPESEAGVMLTADEMAAIDRFNEELEHAGVRLAAEGLKPSAAGFRVRADGERRSVVDGPFTEAKELVAGYWLWQVGDLEEARAWARRCPPCGPGGKGEIEVRPLYEADDLEGLTPGDAPR
jgi:hypothetical protein